MAFLKLWLLIILSFSLNVHGKVTKRLGVPSEEDVEQFFTGSTNKTGHTNNWAVLVCTSRFWFNYRHIANTLSIYRTVKRLGIPDSHIILMLADDVACNPRNRYPATVFNNKDRKLDLYGGPIEQGNDGTVEVDYRGYEVTVESFIRLLTGRHDQNVPRSKRLMTDDKSNVLVFMTGHGGDEFLKFQDAEEISSHDIADAFQQMNEKKRYNEVLFMVDTCQANTLYSQFYSPNILASGSSKKGQNSLSHHVSHDIGVAVIDRYTYYMLEFMEEKLKSMSSQANLKELFDSLEFYKLNSHVGVREDLFRRDYSKTLITDFFGNIPSVEVTFGSANLNHQKSDNSLISPNIWRITSLLSTLLLILEEERLLSFHTKQKVNV
ncbi:hypothetical protein MP638_000102 [Amoeboaphelidium occidentale]|nr:hypothetical protein MP638_000102 [Amoeboaphelidium occidentale]